MIAVLPLRIYKKRLRILGYTERLYSIPPICKTGKTNLSTISCKSVCVYRKIAVISIKITYFLPFLPDFRTV